MSNKEEIVDAIRGAFVISRRIVKNEITNSVFMVKLSAIIQIIPFDDDTANDDQCIIYTYKDCRYYVQMNFYELTKAVNTCIFEPEKHWELYRS